MTATVAQATDAMTEACARLADDMGWTDALPIDLASIRPDEFARIRGEQRPAPARREQLDHHTTSVQAAADHERRRHDPSWVERPTRDEWREW